MKWNQRITGRAIFEAKDEDFQKATQRVYRTGNLPSHIVLPVFQGSR
jgi:hypothetical protein